jgi:hypothetical protein
MSERPPTAEYLVICRGQWDKTLSQDEIQSATEKFYFWYDRLINEGKMKPGQRLTSEGKTVARKNVITDGPFGESKEAIGGYWFILAQSLAEPYRSPKATRVWTAAFCSKSGPLIRSVRRRTTHAKRFEHLVLLRAPC